MGWSAATSHTLFTEVAQYGDVYELMRVRLHSVGPPEARFDDVILDLRKPWGDAAEPEGQTFEAGDDVRVHPAHSTLIVGENGVGKSTLLRLISSVLVRPQPPEGALVARTTATRGLGHVALEWRRPQTGDHFVTGRIVRSRPDGTAATTEGWYSFSSGETVGLDTLPLGQGDPAGDASSFPERLQAALQPGARFMWTRSRTAWEEHLRNHGFNVRWFQWVADHLAQRGKTRDWTEERLIDVVLHETISSEVFDKLNSLGEDYERLRHSEILAQAVANGILQAKKQSMVELFEKMIDDMLTTMENVRQFSRLPDGLRFGLGGRELIRITCRRRDGGQRSERLAAVLVRELGAATPDFKRLFRYELREAVDIAIEVCVPCRSASDSPRYYPLDDIPRLSGGEATSSRLLLNIMVGIVIARVAQTRGDEHSEEVGPVLLDEHIAVFEPVISDIFAETMSALGLQVIYATARSDLVLLARFPAVIVIRSDRAPSFGGKIVRSAFPILLPPAVGNRVSRNGGVMNLVPFDEVFEVPQSSAGGASNDGNDENQDRVLAEELTAHDLRAGEFGFPPSPRVPRQVRKQELLRPGDFVLARVWDRGPVPIAVVSSDDSLMVASESVLVLRPRSPLRPGEEFFYLEYIRSDNMLGAFTDRDGLAVVTPKSLTCSLVPRPDGATLTAITELIRAAEAFQSWQREADDAIHGFFQWTDLETARSYMIEAGRLTRQRREAASLVNEVGARLRTTLPYPIARCWREVQAARPDEAGYTLILECAEAAIAYCATLGLVFAREAQVSLRRVSDLPRQVRRGMTFSAWRNLLREVSEVATSQDVASDSPLAQFRCFADADVADAIRSLHDRRNQKSHRRGPAAHEMEDAVIKARRHLEVVLSRVEWLVDYPLRHIDACRWDSFTSNSQITYRELMGDHNIVSPVEENVPHMLETGSAYITDSYGHYRLLRPYLLAQPCPQCGQLTVFVIDQWNVTNHEAEYLALDHSHKITIKDGEASLRQVGFL